MDDDRGAGFRRLEIGVTVGFQQGEIEVVSGPDEGEFMVRIELTLGPGEDEDEDPEEMVEWAAFGFVFTLASLSFADARPRGMSEPDYTEGDGLRVGDFVENLSYQRGHIRYSADYLRGRRVKTDIEARPDGTVELETQGRGKAALRWLDALEGKKRLQVVSGADAD